MFEKHRPDIFLITGILLLALAAPLGNRLHPVGKKHLMDAKMTGARGAVLMAALAGFKGLATNVLWMKIHRLQEEQNYYRIPSYGRLILDMEPYLSDIWLFIGTTIAFDITHHMEDKETKFQWILAGFQFMEEGARENPQDARLALYLGLRYAFRFSQRYLADAEYYQRRLIKETGKGYLEHAGFWLERARQLNNQKSYFIHINACRMLGHCHKQIAQQAINAGEYEKAMKMINMSIRYWQGAIQSGDDLVAEEFLTDLHSLKKKIDGMLQKYDVQNKDTEQIL